MGRNWSHLNLLEQQDYKCALTNVSMYCPKTYTEYHKQMKNNWKLISLDRIDSTKGYIEGNIQFVCSWVNLAKGTYSNEMILEIFKEINRQV